MVFATLWPSGPEVGHAELRGSRCRSSQAGLHFVTLIFSMPTFAKMALNLLPGISKTVSETAGWNCSRMPSTGPLCCYISSQRVYRCREVTCDLKTFGNLLRNELSICTSLGFHFYLVQRQYWWESFVSYLHKLRRMYLTKHDSPQTTNPAGTQREDSSL